MTLPVRYEKIQIRNDAAADWTSNDPTLLVGELGYETDTGKFKIGDGVTAWTSLAYFYDPAIQVMVKYGEIHCHDASTPQTIPTGASYTKSTAFTDNGEASGITADAANDKLTITAAGIYRVAGSFSFTSDTNNVVWKGALFVDGVEKNNVHWERKVGTGADLGNASFTGLVDVPSVPVDVDFRVNHDNGAGVALTITYANLNLAYVGPT